ncbi:unnamed protein product [Calypogeia fissa]
MYTSITLQSLPVYFVPRQLSSARSADAPGGQSWPVLKRQRLPSHVSGNELDVADERVCCSRERCAQNSQYQGRAAHAYGYTLPIRFVYNTLRKQTKLKQPIPKPTRSAA